MIIFIILSFIGKKRNIQKKKYFMLLFEISESNINYSIK